MQPVADRTVPEQQAMPHRRGHGRGHGIAIAGSDLAGAEQRSPFG